MDTTKTKKILSLLRELLVVFIGVFAAFLLNDYWNNQIELKDKIKTYKIIYEDLDRYYESGRIENKNGFINLFQSAVSISDSIIKNKQIPKGFGIYGDYWNIELINSMLLSGKLNDIDPELFKDVSRFHTVHKNMIDNIEKLNKFYDQQVVPNLDKGATEFYDNDTGELKLKYLRLIEYEHIILSISESTVAMANALKEEIKAEYL